MLVAGLGFAVESPTQMAGEWHEGSVNAVRNGIREARGVSVRDGISV